MQVRRRFAGSAATIALLMIGAACGSSYSEQELADAAGQLVSGETGGGATTGSQEQSSGQSGATQAAGTDANNDVTDGSTGAGGDAADRGGEDGPERSQNATESSGDCSGRNTEPIRIGNVSTMSGVVGSALAGWENALRAWAESVNASGGINCHPLELTLVDDGADPSRYRSLVQELVEQRGVVALVHQVAPLSGQAGVSYIQDRQVPVVGVEGGEPWANDNSMYFTSFANDKVLGYSYAAGTARTFVPEGKTKLATIFCAEIKACETTTDHAAFEAEGMDLVYSAKVSLAQPDYTAQCLGARNAGAEVVYLAVETQSTLRLANNCASIGYNPPYAIPGQVTSDDQLESPNLEGAALLSAVLPWFADGQPAFDRFRAAMQQFSPGAPLNGSAIQGWTSAMLLEAALQNIDAPTSANVLQGLYSMKNNDLGGLTYPITFEPGQKNPLASQKSCWWIVRIQSGKWTSPDNFKRNCR